MDQSRSTAKWIGSYMEYMEWTTEDTATRTLDTSRLARYGIAEPGLDVSREFVAAYLDWMDASMPLSVSRPNYRIAAAVPNPGNDDNANRLDALWEALMVALLTDPDFKNKPVLREIVEAANTRQSAAVSA